MVEMWGILRGDGGNRYCYVHGNPIRGRDPTGTQDLFGEALPNILAAEHGILTDQEAHDLTTLESNAHGAGDALGYVVLGGGPTMLRFVQAAGPYADLAEGVPLAESMLLEKGVETSLSSLALRVGAAPSTYYALSKLDEAVRIAGRVCDNPGGAFGLLAPSFYRMGASGARRSYLAPRNTDNVVRGLRWIEDVILDTRYFERDVNVQVLDDFQFQRMGLPEEVDAFYYLPTNRMSHNPTGEVIKIDPRKELIPEGEWRIRVRNSLMDSDVQIQATFEHELAEIEMWEQRFFEMDAIGQ